MAFCKNFFSSLSLFSVFILAGCAYAIDSSNQFITFETPGAQNARCSVYVDKLRYKIYPPQTVNIKKSQKDMEISCMAPGNRRVNTTVPSVVSERAVWGGPVGVAWDYASKSLFYYPSIVAIDFSQEELVPEKLPQHNNSDIRQPETYDLEEFKALQPRLNSDKRKVQTPLVRRGSETSDESLTGTPEPVSAPNKGDLQSVISGLTDAPEPSPAESEPVSIYPGQ